MVLVATAAGLSATVRRTAFALLPVMVVMVLLAAPQAAGIAAAALFRRGPRAISGRSSAPSRRRRRSCTPAHSSSLMGRHMFAKAALIDAPPAPTFAKATAGKPPADPVRAALDRHLEDDYAPIRASPRVRAADLRAVLSIYYETCLQGGCVDRSRALMPDVSEAEQTEDARRGGDGADPARAARVRAAHRHELSLALDRRSPAPSRSRRRLDRVHRLASADAVRGRSPSRSNRSRVARVPGIAARSLRCSGRLDVVGDLDGGDRAGWASPRHWRCRRSCRRCLTIAAVCGARRARLPAAHRDPRVRLLAIHAGRLARDRDGRVCGAWSLLPARVYCAVMFARPFRNTNF